MNTHTQTHTPGFTVSMQSVWKNPQQKTKSFRQPGPFGHETRVCRKPCPTVLPWNGRVNRKRRWKVGTKSKCPVLSWSGTGLMSICLFLHVFVGFYGGNPGEHGKNIQTPHRKAREQAPTCCTMRDLNPRPSCCEATVLHTEAPCPNST